MLARLWWKEYRLLGPVWLILVVAAGLLQWLFRSVDSPDARTGGLTVAALAWAVLYAFASGAAAFAGERESKTLGFLDALPVGRGSLWLGKASFALVSTYGLALVLAGMAALGTESRSLFGLYSYAEIVRVFGTLLFEAVAWSLLWSSFSKNPLLAGVMAVLSVYASGIAISILPGLDVTLGTTDLVGTQAMPFRLAAALAALAVSGVAMTWNGPTGSRARARPAVVEPAPVAIRTSSTGRSLLWQALREGLTTWLFVGMVGLAVALGSDQPMNGLPSFLAVLASLVAGVSVFGTETASGSRRFLVHHGVGPGTVWGRKMLAWVVVVGSIFGTSLYGSWSLRTSEWIQGAPRDTWRNFVMLALTLANGFSIGVLCGMAIPRRLTATMVGVVLMVAIVPVQVALGTLEMVPDWSLFLVPLAFVAASRGWAADWMFEREGARPWLRLGAWVGVPLVALGASYVGYRAFGVPDMGPQSVAADLVAGPARPEEDAGASYRTAADVLRAAPIRGPSLDAQVREVIDHGWGSAELVVVDWWGQNQAAIDLARRASALPLARFKDADPATPSSRPDPAIANARALAALLGLDAIERLSRADLPGAWDDILAQFRIANQLATNKPTLGRSMIALDLHQRAVGLAFDWLGAGGQSSASLRRALVDLKALPALPTLANAIQVESSIVERALDLSGDELAAWIRPDNGRDWSALEALWFTKVVAPPWERSRARRIGRMVVAQEIPRAVLEPYLRNLSPAFVPPPVWDLVRDGKLLPAILPNFEGAIARIDREQVGRRALDQAVAIEAWKLEQGGTYPKTLQVLVPGYLERLPLDPYSGKPYGYARSEGEGADPPIQYNREPGDHFGPTRPGQPFLYSVGPDLKDDGGRPAIRSGRANSGDYVFAIP